LKFSFFLAFVSTTIFELTMEMSYLLKCYEDIILQVKASLTINNKKSLNVLFKYESDSYRIFKITINKSEDRETINVSKPIHSFHPEVQKLELKSIIHLNDFENYIPLLKKDINFSGEKVLFALDPHQENVFFLYEKCTLTELNQNEIFFLYCNKFLIQKNDSIKKAVKEKVFKLNTKSKIENYIQKNQLLIDSKLNQLLKKINPKSSNELYKYSNDYNKRDCLKTVYLNLEKLMIFIDNEYKSYLNENIFVPQRTLVFKELEIKTKLDFTRDYLLTIEVNKELLIILFEPLILLSNINSLKQITHCQFNYALEYVKGLMELFQSTPFIFSESDWHQWLFDMNINSFTFFDYLTNVIQEEIINCESDAEKLQLLFSKLKQYNQHRFKIKKAFNNNLPDIQTQVSNWIEEEILFINRKLSLENTNIVNNNESITKDKILINLSVAQISYFMNILLQANIIKHSNQRDIFRMISDNFKTNGTDTISVDSLSSKFYNVEDTTKIAIREKIIELMNLSKK